MRDGIGSSAALAHRLLEQASHQHAGAKIAALARRGPVQRLTGSIRQSVLAAGDLLDVKDEAAILKALTDGLIPTDAVTIDSALRALDARGQAIVAEAEIHQILFYSGELPLPTMLICQHTLDWLENDTVTSATVRQAIADARRHPSWELFGE